jgi:YidC/Oxa1 family membrane protein insertase
MFDPILEPVYRLLTAVADATTATLAIVLCTLAVRLLLLPLSVRQARSARRRAALAPEIQ